MRYNRVEKGIQCWPDVERDHGRFSEQPVHAFPFTFRFRFDHLSINTHDKMLIIIIIC